MTLTNYDEINLDEPFSNHSGKKQAANRKFEEKKDFITGSIYRFILDEDPDFRD